MHVNETKFERNSSLEYYHMTCIAKTKHTSERGLLDQVVFSHARTTKAANSKAFTCKLRDNTAHSKGLIT